MNDPITVREAHAILHGAVSLATLRELVAEKWGGQKVNGRWMVERQRVQYPEWDVAVWQEIFLGAFRHLTADDPQAPNLRPRNYFEAKALLSEAGILNAAGTLTMEGHRVAWAMGLDGWYCALLAEDGSWAAVRTLDEFPEVFTRNGRVDLVAASASLLQADGRLPSPAVDPAAN